MKHRKLTISDGHSWEDPKLGHENQPCRVPQCLGHAVNGAEIEQANAALANVPHRDWHDDPTQLPARLRVMVQELRESVEYYRQTMHERDFEINNFDVFIRKALLRYLPADFEFSDMDYLSSGGGMGGDVYCVIEECIKEAIDWWRKQVDEKKVSDNDQA